MPYAQKIPFCSSLSNFTQRVINDNFELLGQVLPCSVTEVNGPIVTVKFEVTVPDGITLPPVTCPIAESSYVRLPVQVGDKGITLAANTRLGGISGLGTGLADLTNPSNLGGLVFVPIGNANWSTVTANKLNLNGPGGVTIQDTAGDCLVNVTETGVTVVVGGMSVTVTGSTLTATVGTSTIEMDSSSINLTATTINLNGAIGLNGDITQNLSTTVVFQGDVVGDGISLVSHVHGGVTTGSGDTTPPI